jgi:transketolase
MRKAFVDSLLEWGKVNKPPFLLTGDLGYSVLEPFQQTFPANFINVGIMEQSMISFGAGLQLSTQKPVFIYSINNFVTFRALEQIRLDIGYHDLGICLVGVGAGFQYQTAGYSHWGVEDLAAIASLEKFSISTPSDSQGVKTQVQQFLNNPKPTYLRLGKIESELTNFQNIENFQGLRRLGIGSKYLLTHGSLAAVIANHKNFNPELFSLFIFDRMPEFDDLSLINLIRSAKSISVIEEVIFSGGLGSRISRVIAENRISIEFSWTGINGRELQSAGGEINYLRNRELGENYLENVLNSNG